MFPRVSLAHPLDWNKGDKLSGWQVALVDNIQSTRWGDAKASRIYSVHYVDALPDMMLVRSPGAASFLRDGVL